jgi:RES domain-containing protein
LRWRYSRIWFTCPHRTFTIGYVSVAAVLPDSLTIATEQDLRLRADLRELRSQDLGDWWIDSKKSAVLEVPSAVVTGEHIYLLNPAHPDFARIVADPPALFHFGPRLFRQV